MRTIADALRCSILPPREICDLRCPWLVKEKVKPDSPEEADTVIDCVEYWISCDRERIVRYAADALEKAQTMIEYQREAMRTASEKCRNLANAGLGLTGEAGEAADLIKKHLFHGHELDKEALVKELGDVLWYVALTSELIGVQLEDVMRLNVEKLRERYPDGFDPERSIHR